jgi:tellurite resistance protein
MQKSGIREKGRAMLDPHGALIYTMVIVSAAESNLSDGELQMIGDMIGQLPVFRDFDREALPRLLDDCAESLGRDDGLEATLKEINKALPAKLHETAYAIACDLVAADGKANQEELQLLELIRHRLNVDRLSAAAIERGARARFQTL